MKGTGELRKERKKKKKEKSYRTMSFEAVTINCNDVSIMQFSSRIWENGYDLIQIFSRDFKNERVRERERKRERKKEKMKWKNKALFQIYILCDI